MSTYDGNTFYCRIPDGMRPDWEQEPNITRRHIPYSYVDDVQSAGIGALRLSVPARVDSDADLAALRGAVGVDKRTLYDYYGTNYTGVMLVALRNPRRLANSEVYFVDLEFLRDGA